MYSSITHVIKILLCFSSLLFSLGQEIIFEDVVSNNGTETDSCRLPSGKIGDCKPITKCAFLLTQINEGVINHANTSCGWEGIHVPLVCCPTDHLQVTKSIPIDDFSRPVHDFLKYCGYPIYEDSFDLPDIYRMNETAAYLEKMGFTVTPVIVDEDLIQVYIVSNGTHSKVESTPIISHAVGGFNARRILTVYMAIIGNIVRKVPNWYCDGVIINRNWVLSAAHCFVERDPDVVRLGEYDLGNDTVTRNEFPMDFGIKNIVFYPEYQYPSAYHDLVLIELDRAIPYHRPDMRPICLPWGKGVERNLVGEKITVTGWGATVFGGPFTPVVQEVNVTVFDASICDRSYSKLPDYREKFPKGITKDTTLCAGDLQGGKDSCQGDSGGPVVYKGEYDVFTLAGIVSTGFGCGLQEYPGIYVPINKPQYLSWIKKVAFV